MTRSLRKVRTVPRAKRMRLTATHFELAGLIVAVLLYAWFTVQQRFIQDDAFITYRYVANFLDGHGLVWNIGERVEGITNFGWAVILACIGRFGGDFVLFSRIIGFLCGVGIVVASWFIARKITDGVSVYAILLAIFLIGANGALAYWSAAGLETAAFGLMASLSFYLYFARNRMFIWSLLMAVWMRPDGVVIGLALLIAEAVSERKIPWFVISCGVVAGILSLPMLLFKLTYYGSLFPNSFYAKTGVDITQISNGMAYTWEFLRDYGFLGIGPLILLVRYKHLSRQQQALLVAFVVFLGYIVVIGGDVLKVYRFFIPILGISAIVVGLAALQLVSLLKGKMQAILWVILLVILPVLTWSLPRATIHTFLQNERDLVTKMKSTGNNLQNLDRSEFTIATSTIGALGYTLRGHRVIDMLGLTDSMIARHPEEQQENISSTWKERSFNTPYLFSQSPDYVLFSTGIKPSAPAEKALFQYRQWDLCYRAIPVDMPFDEASGRFLPNYLFKRVRTPAPPFVPVFSKAFVERLTVALQDSSVNNPKSVLTKLDEAEQMLQGERCLFVQYWKATLSGPIVGYENSLALMNELLTIDSLFPGAHRDLYVYAVAKGMIEKAAIHRDYLQRLSPVDLEAAETHLKRIGISH